MASMLLLALLSCGYSSLTYAQGTRHILFLNSYHAGYKWSDEIFQGFLEAISPLNDDIALHIEYLDIKRYYSEERFAHLAESLAIKYRDTPVDLLVSSDDAAFMLLQRQGKKLFPGLPVFFCGTNYLDPDELDNLPHFSGVNERADIGATFKAIMEVLPNTEHIYVINDLTVTGRKVHTQIEQAITQYSDRVAFTLWEDIAMVDLLTKVKDIQKNSVIFYTFFLRDNTGRSFEYDQAISLLSQQSNVPIFGAWDFNLNLGLADGMLTSGYQQGKAVAELVNAWRNSTPLTAIPRLSSSPNRYMFDYNQLNRFGIHPGLLPAGSIIINQPTTFIQKHKPVLITSGLFISLLLLIISILTANIFRRKKAEQELSRSEENFRSIFNNANDGLYQATADGHFIRVNPALARMLKFSTPDEVINHFTDIYNQLYTSPINRKDFLNRYQDIGWAKGEHCLNCRDGSVINVIENMHTVCNKTGKFLYFEGCVTDITEYKKTQELIAQTENYFAGRCFSRYSP